MIEFGTKKNRGWIQWVYNKPGLEHSASTPCHICRVRWSSYEFAQSAKIFLWKQSNLHIQCQRSVLKGKIQLLTSRSETLIPFNVLSFGLHTHPPVVLSLLEAFQEDFFGDGLQLGHHISYNVFLWQILFLAVALSDWGTVSNCKEPCWESRRPDKSEECCIWPNNLNLMWRISGYIVWWSWQVPFAHSLVVCITQHYEGNRLLPRCTLR